MCIGHQISKYLKYQREKQNLSLNELGNRIGLTTSFLSRLEAGDYQDVKFTVVEKIASGLSMSTHDFLTKIGAINSENTKTDLDYSLKENYQFPKKARDEIVMMIDFFRQKYKKDIDKLTKKHRKYWQEVK